MKFIMPVEVVFETDTEVRYAIAHRDGTDWLTCSERVELPQPIRLDVWDLRQRFIKLVPEPGALVTFINEAKVMPEYHDQTCDYWFNWQRALKILMTTPPGRWGSLADKFRQHSDRSVREAIEHARYSAAMYVSFQWKHNDLPHLELICSELLDAMVVSICVDYARGAKFAWCRDKSCGRPFLVGSPRQIYCDRDCLHRALVRRSRERARMAKKNKNHTGRGGSFRRGAGRG